MELFEILQLLNQTHGPSGDEGGIRAAITQYATLYADEITTDTMGNLIVRKRGNGPKVMLAAHMDSIGFIVTHIEKEGFLRVGRVGGVTPSDVLNTPVQFKNGTRGIFVKEEKSEGKLKLDQCYIDIGAEDADQARTMVQVGDTAVFDAPCFRMGNNNVVTPYQDNRAACVILLDALSKMQESPNDVYFVFTAQEEVGIRGAKTATWAIDPDYGIAVDVTDVDDTPGSERAGTTQLGKGAAIKIMDSSVICHPEMVAKLDQLAKTNDIPVQRDILRAGGTDAGAIHTTRIGVITGGISIPCRYIHMPIEMANLQDFKACVDLILAFVQSNLESK